MTVVDVGEFARVLEIGLGRAVMLLQRPSPAPYRDAILHVCLHNTAYDPQCEGRRAEYVLDVIGLTGDEDWYRDRILETVGLLPRTWTTGTQIICSTSRPTWRDAATVTLVICSIDIS